MTENTLQDKISIQQLEELKLVGYQVHCDGDQYITEIPKASLARALNKWHTERFLDYENKDQLKVQLSDTIL